MAAPRRNIELKASDPDPERSLAVVLGLGARDRGLLRQRDTYFRVASGRLKLREEDPGGAMLIQYDRVDADEARESRYRLIPVDDPKTLCAALEASLGLLAVVEKERHLLLWQNVRIHLDRVKDLGDFVELEGVATPDSDLAQELESVTRLTEALEIAPERILRNSYSDQVVGSSALVDAARAVMERAHAPYSRYRVGAALRAEDGSIHVGANVENAAYPQGQCAEASAIGALIAAGRTPHHRGRRDLRRRRLLRALRRLPSAAARVHRPRSRDPRLHVQRRAPDDDARGAAAALLRPGVPAAVTALDALAGFAPRLGIVLGSGLGGLADALEDATHFPYAELEGFPRPSVAGHGGTLSFGTLHGLPVAVYAGRKHIYEGGDPGAMRVPIRTLKALGADALLVTNAAGSLRGEVGPGRLMAISDHINLLGVNPLTGPNDDAVGPRFPSLRDAYDPELRDQLRTAAGAAADRPRRGRLPRHRRAELRDAGRDPRCSARSARMPSACLPCPR